MFLVLGRLGDDIGSAWPRREAAQSAEPWGEAGGRRFEAAGERRRDGRQQNQRNAETGPNWEMQFHDEFWSAWWNRDNLWVMSTGQFSTGQIFDLRAGPAGTTCCI